MAVASLSVKIPYLAKIRDLLYFLSKSLAHLNFGTRKGVAMKLRTNSNDLYRKRRKRLILTTLLLPLILAVALSSYTLGGFYRHRSLFNLAADSKDQSLAEKELAALEYYYGLSVKWRMRWLADRFFYKETYLDKGIYFYLIGDFERVINDKNLQEHQDNHLVSQLIGSAKFRKAEALYKEAKTKTGKEKIIKMITDDCSDFRRAVENGPGPGQYFAHSLNFDICSDPDAVRMVLENPGPPRLKLGYKPDNQSGSGQPKGDRGDRIDPLKPGGVSGMKKKG